MKTRLEVLHVPDCPNLPPLLQRLGEITDLPVTTREIRTDTEAAAAGMTGSPTLLVDGVDPFTTDDDCPCGISCRLYRDDRGRIVPVPSAEQLRTAIPAGDRAAPAAAGATGGAQHVVDSFRRHGPSAGPAPSVG